MKNIFIFSYLICATLTCGSCAGSIPTPDLSHAERASHKWHGTTLQDLTAGRKLYIQKCSGCHGLKDPAGFSAQQWEKILPEMKVKAGVQKDEEVMIMKYLVTISEADNETRKR